MSTGTEIIKANGAVEHTDKPEKYRATTFAPRTFGQLLEFSEMAARSALVPPQYVGKPADILIAIQFGAELGLAPMQSLQSIAVINSRPALWGDGLLAVAQTHPDYECHREWQEGEGSERAAFCEVKRRGSEPHTVRFSMKQAVAAGLLTRKDRNGKPVETPWNTYPERMLQMRARSWALRDKFADALRGCIAAEEVMDMQPDPEPERPAPRRLSEQQQPERKPPQTIEQLEASAYLSDEDIGLGTNALPTDSNKTQPAAPPPQRVPKGSDRITNQQASDLFALAKKHKLSAKQVLDHIGSEHGCEKSTELTQDMLVKVCRWIEEHQTA